MYEIVSMYVRNKIYETLFADSETFIFKKKQSLFIEEDNPSDKAVTIEEDLEAVEVDGMESLMNLPRLMFVDGE